METVTETKIPAHPCTQATTNSRVDYSQKKDMKIHISQERDGGIVGRLGLLHVCDDREPGAASGVEWVMSGVSKDTHRRKDNSPRDSKVQQPSAWTHHTYTFTHIKRWAVFFSFSYLHSQPLAIGCLSPLSAMYLSYVSSQPRLGCIVSSFWQPRPSASFTSFTLFNNKYTPPSLFPFPPSLPLPPAANNSP